jgi:NAD(P)H dehydrogenase (quinone)
LAAGWLSVSQSWGTSYLAIAKGDHDVVSDTVPRLTSHPALSMREFLALFPDSYAHLLRGKRL